MSHAVQRGSIFLEAAEVLEQQAFPDKQYVLRLRAPECARRARPGSFAHITCDPALPMRRPMSILRVSPTHGWFECLYKVVGEGSCRLANRRPGDVLSCLGPIGTTFTLHPRRRRLLLLGGGVGIPPMVFLAESLAADTRAQWRPLVLMGSEVPFPFETRASTRVVAGLPAEARAGLAPMEDQGIASRLASLQGYAGCYRGYVTDLAREWLTALDPGARAETEIFACGPTAMLRAAAQLAQEFEIPSQVSLEEFMACGVGGCAGCNVAVQTPEGPTMQRVCVDGPVFDGASVFPQG